MSGPLPVQRWPQVHQRQQPLVRHLLPHMPPRRSRRIQPREEVWLGHNLAHRYLQAQTKLTSVKVVKGQSLPYKQVPSTAKITLVQVSSVMLQPTNQLSHVIRNMQGLKCPRMKQASLSSGSLLFQKQRVRTRAWARTPHTVAVPSKRSRKVSIFHKREGNERVVCIT